MPFQALEASEKICDDNEVSKAPNTYRTEPRNSFKTELVDQIVKSVMNNRLDEFTYNDEDSAKLCSDIASEIRRRVKKLNFDRYKIVVVVTIVEKVSQSLETILGYLWNSEKDNYSTFSLEGPTFHAYCYVFGLYYE